MGICDGSGDENRSILGNVSEITIDDVTRACLPRPSQTTGRALAAGAYDVGTPPRPGGRP